MNANTASIICLILVVVGVAMIILGMVMTYGDWHRKQFGKDPTAKPEALPETITALTKLLVALKDYPPGQRLIVFGILLLIIGGIFGGIEGLQSIA